MIIYPTRDWLGVIFRVRGTVIRQVAGRTLITAAIAAAAVYLKRVRGIDLAIPTVVHTIIGAALGCWSSAPTPPTTASGRAARSSA